MKQNSSYLAQWKRPEILLFLAASIIVLASRLPWITAGFGTDADSFRVFNAAKSILETGEYSLSRYPGYPLHEFIVALLVPFGPTGTNMLSALFSTIAFVFFALVLRRSRVRPFLMGALGFAFTPIVYINSTSTIDYVPAIACVLAATYFVLSRRFFVAGFCLGLSIGFRITSGAMLVPLVLWIALDKGWRIALRQSFQLVTVTLLTAIICFVPVIIKYGLGFFSFVDNSMYPSLSKLLSKGILSVWGLIGILALLGLCFLIPLYIKNIKLHLAERQTRSLVLLATVSTAIYVIAFLRLPHESGYLVPIVPFTIMLIGLLLPPAYIRMLTLALVLSSFITIGRQGITLDGPVLQNHNSRVSSQKQSLAIIKAVKRLPQNAIVVAGWKLPAIKTHMQSAGGDPSQYVYLIQNQNTCVEYQNEGRQIFFLPRMDNYNMRIHGVDLRQHHAQQLNLLDEE